MNCKYCHSANVIKFGQVKNVPRYFCKDCRRKFVSAGTIPKMQTGTATIASVLDMYYKGMSETAIRRALIQQGSDRISTGTVYNWVRRFAGLARQETVGLVPKVGREWVADETLLRLVGRDVCFWDVIDKGTHFLIASHMSLTRTVPDARELMRQACTSASAVPGVIYTDKLALYLTGLDSTPERGLKGEPRGLFSVGNNASLIEHFHAAFKERTRIMHRLRSMDNIRWFMESWLAHYNYFRPNAFLAGRTPADMAGIKFPFRTWKNFIEQPYAKTTRIPSYL
ncbi:MAG: IS1/IS6 family transposase [Dehalococcoidia bacterium]|jgi:transposase-like protein|nr:MAG: IS1/IS6 family transposase [Dehalococcoidia bacterium]